MEIEALPGVSGDQLLDQLKAAKTNLGNFGTSDTIQLFSNYLTWANNFAGNLVRFLGPEEVNRMVTTPAYWNLQGLIPLVHNSMGPSPVLRNLSGFLNMEIQERHRILDQTITDVTTELDRWKEVDGTLVFADTNVYLHQEKEFGELPWNSIVSAEEKHVHLIIPLLVVDELDRQKRVGNGKVAGSETVNIKTRARLSVRFINELFPQTSKVAELHSKDSLLGLVTASLLMEVRNHIRLSHADSEFVERARAVQDFTGRKVHVVSSDIGMALRARAAGLETFVLPDSP
jgi:hypothetical protein